MDPGPKNSTESQSQNKVELPPKQHDGYIPLEHSESDSDVEIDLHTQPPKKTYPKVPKHFRKSNAQVYDNISVYAPPDSNLIFRCSRKRANWYLSRSLARSLSPNSIHLTFAPAGQGHVNDPYFLEERENKCVVCAKETAEAGATMLHVVPEQYRKWFPLRLKSHSSHDIVVACPECNAQWDREAAIVRKEIVRLYGIPLEGVGWIKDYEAGAAKRAAGAVVTEWKRRWQEQRDQDASAKAATTPAKTVETGAAAVEGGFSVKKSKKNKAANKIPEERMQILEQTVLDWWTKTQTSSEKPSHRKRELQSEEPKKKRKLESKEDGPKACENSLSMPLRDMASVPEDTESTVKKYELKAKNEASEIEVPNPPPSHTTLLDQTMLRSALNAQASYRGPDYKEHGQLVVARIMASSASFHDDPAEAAETKKVWQEAEPLQDAPQGWRDVGEFIRTWRGEFLRRTQPGHLSDEWRVDNPV
ncbi:hypothetical protein BGZ70_006996 [Mortierella alpina]|uniref:Uncharacterized protein n=1 Tax=Mortierella alpina TaxID=64518 RepID=A0A9P6M3I6_MORAP|nr:hypothetical protein BGZ70_006996 [Mortierella alpina]